MQTVPFPAPLAGQTARPAHRRMALVAPQQRWYDGGDNGRHLPQARNGCI